MKTVEFTLEFLTPAFLGDATQSGRWRTPPIKALLRQYWRMAYAADKKFAVDVNAMRQEEGRLFGMAGEGKNDAASKSLVRMRLSQWSVGTLKNWVGNGTVTHPEVKNREGRITPVGADLYMGFGPLVYKQGTALKANAAMQAGESATLSLAYPQAAAPLLEAALRLMHAYGTLGGRSRNGWGSFALSGLDEASKAVLLSNNSPTQRPLADCLQQDWPTAVGQGLVWQTKPHADWKTLMRTLAEIKIGLRTKDSDPSKKQADNSFSLAVNTARRDRELPNDRGVSHGSPAPRHWLAYPVTKHSVDSWGGNARLPNSLRFKVRQTPDGRLVGVIVHMPCKPPSEFAPRENELLRVWQQVHSYLDKPTSNLQRIPA